LRGLRVVFSGSMTVVDPEAFERSTHQLEIESTHAIQKLVSAFEKLKSDRAGIENFINVIDI
jgi:hypothetical protein